MLTAIKNNKSLTFYQSDNMQRDSELYHGYCIGKPSIMLAGADILPDVTLQTGSINQAYSQLKESVINRGMRYANNTTASRGGLMAEDFHAGTYDLDAVIKKSDTRAAVPESHEKCSPDVVIIDKNGKQQEFSLKFMQNAEESAKAQTNPGYAKQGRIVPADQLSEAKKVLDDMSRRNELKGRDEAAGIQKETKELLNDRIHGKDGVESMPLTKEQDLELAKAINKDDRISTEKNIEKVFKKTGVKSKVIKAIFRNEIPGLGRAAAIGLGVGFSIGFAISLAQSGITPDSFKNALVEGGKSSFKSGVESIAGYGIARTVGQAAANAVEGAVGGILDNIGITMTENISKMCNIGVVGAITISVFSIVQFYKLTKSGKTMTEAAVYTGRQAMFSLSLLAVSIAAQGIWGGSAGIIVSVSIGIISITYSIADMVYQRDFSEKIRECMISECKPVFG